MDTVRIQLDSMRYLHCCSFPHFPSPSLPAVTGSVRDKMTFRVPQSEVLVALPSIWKVITQITGTVHSSIEPQTSKWASDKMTSREP
jgi:hypothetical protein